MELHNKLALPNRGAWNVDALTYIGLTENSVLRDFMTLIDREADEYGRTGTVDFESVYPKFVQKIIRLFVFSHSKRLSERPLGQIALCYFTPDLKHCEDILSEFEVYVIPIAGKRRHSTIGVRSCSYHLRKKAVKETITCGVDLDRKLIVEAHEKTQHMLTLGSEREKTAFQKTVGAQLVKRVQDKLKAWAESLSLGTMDVFLNYLVAHSPTFSATLVLQQGCQAKSLGAGQGESYRRMDILNKYIKNVEMFTFAVNKFPENFLVHINETKNALPTPCADEADSSDIHTDLGGRVDSIALCGSWTKSRLQRASARGADASVREVTVRTAPKALVNSTEDYERACAGGHHTNVIASDLTSSSGEGSGASRGGLSTMTNSNVKVVYEPPIAAATSKGRYWVLNSGTTVVDDASDVYKTSALESKSNPLINEFEADFFTLLGHIGSATGEGRRVFKGMQASSHDKTTANGPPMSLGQYDHMGAVNYVDFAEAVEFFVKRAVPWVSEDVTIAEKSDPHLHSLYKRLVGESSSDASKCRMQMDENNYARPRHHRALALELHPFFDYSVSSALKGDLLLTAEPRLSLGNVPPYLIPPRVHVLRGHQLLSRFMDQDDDEAMLKFTKDVCGLLQESAFKSSDVTAAVLGPKDRQPQSEGGATAYETQCSKEKLLPYPFFFEWIEAHHTGLTQEYNKLCQLLDGLGRTMLGLAAGLPDRFRKHLHPALHGAKAFTVGMSDKRKDLRTLIFDYVLLPAVWGTTLAPAALGDYKACMQSPESFGYPHVVGKASCTRLTFSCKSGVRTIYLPVWCKLDDARAPPSSLKRLCDPRFNGPGHVAQGSRQHLFGGNFFLSLKALHEQPGISCLDAVAALLSMTLYNNPLTWWLGKDAVHPGVSLTLVKRERFLAEDLLLCKKHSELLFFDNPHMRNEELPRNASRIESDADFTLAFMKNSLAPTGFNSVAASLVDTLTDMGLALETMSDSKYLHPRLVKKTVAVASSDECHKHLAGLLQLEASDQPRQRFAQGKRSTRAAILITPACAKLRHFSQPGNPRGRSSCYSHCCPQLEADRAMWDHSVADPGSTSGESTFNPWASQKYSFSYQLYRGAFSNDSCRLKEVSHYFETPPVYKRGGLLDNIERDFKYNADIGSTASRCVTEEQRTSLAAQHRDRNPSETLGIAFPRMSFTDDVVERDYQDLIKNDYSTGCHRFQCVYKNNSYVIPGGSLLGKLDHGIDFAPSSLNYLNR